jgi:WD40 repeat protein
LLVFVICLPLVQAMGLADDKSGQSEAELRQQLQIERAARKVLTYQGDMRKSAHLAELDQWQQLLALLENYRQQTGQSDLRSWEWYFLRSLARKKYIADRQQFALQGPNRGIYQLSWSGAGERLSAISENGTVTIWDTKNRQELRRLEAGGGSVCWSPKGNRLTTSNQNGTVTLWDAETGRSLRTFAAVKGTFNLQLPAFSLDGRLLALALDPTVAGIVDAVTGNVLSRLQGPKGFASEVAWRPDGQLLATGGSEGTVILWNAVTGKEIATWAAGGDVVGLKWRADGRQIGAVTWPRNGLGRVQIWDSNGYSSVFAADYYPGTAYLPGRRRATLVLSPDGQRICVTNLHGISAWDGATAREIFRSPGGAFARYVGECNAQGTRWAFLEMSGAKATCRVIDINSAQELLRVPIEIPMNHFQAALAWSPDGTLLAAGFASGKVYVYTVPHDLSDVRCLNAGAVRFFQWNPDGQRFAFSSSGSLWVGEWPLTKPLSRLGSPLELPSVISLSPNGKFLAGADGDGTIPIWNISRGEITQRLPGHPQPLADYNREESRPVSTIVWSPDSKHLASLRGSDGSLVVWDVGTGHLNTAFQFGAENLVIFKDNPPPLVWSGNGKLVAVRTGFQEKRVRILDVMAGKQIRQWDGGPDLASPAPMAWDPKGQQLAACLGNPPKIQVWAANTGEETLVISGPALGLRELSWSPDGQRLACLDDTGRIYDLAAKRSVPLQRTLDQDGKAERLVWKPDGSRVALLGPGPRGEGSLKFYDADSGKLALDQQGMPKPDAVALRARLGQDVYNQGVQSLVWNENGLQAAGHAMLGPGSNMLVVWDAQVGRLLWTLRKGQDTDAPSTALARTIAWAPDGRSLASLSGGSLDQSRIDIWDVSSGRKKQTLSGSRINFRGAGALAWSPDGQSLACASETIQVWKLAAPTVPTTLRQVQKQGSESDQLFLDWSPDSGSLAVLDCRHILGHEAVVTGWDIATGRERFSWTRPYQYCDMRAPIAWSPNGKYLAWGGTQPGVWSIATGSEVFPLAGHSNTVVDVQWNPDGHRVLSRCETNAFTSAYELKVWDALTGQEVLMLRGPMAGWLVAHTFKALLLRSVIHRRPAMCRFGTSEPRSRSTSACLSQP